MFFPPIEKHYDSGNFDVQKQNLPLSECFSRSATQLVHKTGLVETIFVVVVAARLIELLKRSSSDSTKQSIVDYDTGCPGVDFTKLVLT